MVCLHEFELIDKESFTFYGTHIVKKHYQCPHCWLYLKERHEDGELVIVVTMQWDRPMERRVKGKGPGVKQLLLGLPSGS